MNQDVKKTSRFVWVVVCKDYAKKMKSYQYIHIYGQFTDIFQNHVGHYTYLKLVKLACYEKCKGVKTHLDSSR